MNFAKSVFLSKTIWINTLTAIVTYAAPVMGLLHIDPMTQKAIVALNAVNIALRLVTKGPVYVLNDAAHEP